MAEVTGTNGAGDLDDANSVVVKPDGGGVTDAPVSVSGAEAMGNLELCRWQ